MRVAVYDTYVTKRDGTVMHFDIIVPNYLKNEQIIHNYGKQFLKSKGQEGQPLSSKECRFYHVVQGMGKMLVHINTKGYAIIEMEGCKS